MTALQRLSALIWVRIYAVSSYLAFQRGNHLEGAIFENMTRRLQSDLDRDAFIREMVR